MHQEQLITTQNLLFLEIRWLAQQSCWTEIIEHPQWQELSVVPAPRSTRSALLTAYHHEYLKLYDSLDSVDVAIETHKEHQGKLGTLLQFHRHQTQTPVVRVFAYHAVVTDDAALMQQLKNIDTDDDTQNLLNSLEKRFTRSDHEVQASINECMELQRLDEAWEILSTLSDPIRRIRNMFTIAMLNHSAEYAQETLEAYERLEHDVRQTLYPTKIIVDNLIAELTTYVAPQVSEMPILDTWTAWLRIYTKDSDPDVSYYSESLDFLDAQQGNHIWANETLHVLNDLLDQIYVEDGLRDPLIRRMLDGLLTEFMNQTDFPQSSSVYVHLYETLFTVAADRTYATRAVNEVNSRLLLRLADAILWASPQRYTSISQLLSDWFESPVPSLESEVIEAFELLSLAGIEGYKLASLHRTWVEDFLQRPKTPSLTILETWYDLAMWVQVGQDIIDRLSLKIDEVTKTESSAHPFATLEEGYRVGIFTLRTETAQRAEARLKMYNPGIQVDIFDMKSSDKRAKALARNANMVVIVTACLSHSLYYAIQDIVTDPVYVNTSGTTGILRSIEAHISNVGQ